MIGLAALAAPVLAPVWIGASMMEHTSAIDPALEDANDGISPEEDVLISDVLLSEDMSDRFAQMCPAGCKYKWKQIRRSMDNANINIMEKSRVCTDIVFIEETRIALVACIPFAGTNNTRGMIKYSVFNT